MTYPDRNGAAYEQDMINDGFYDPDAAVRVEDAVRLHAMINASVAGWDELDRGVADAVDEDASYAEQAVELDSRIARLDATLNSPAGWDNTDPWVRFSSGDGPTDEAYDTAVARNPGGYLLGLMERHEKLAVEADPRTGKYSEAIADLVSRHPYAIGEGLEQEQRFDLRQLLHRHLLTAGVQASVRALTEHKNPETIESDPVYVIAQKADSYAMDATAYPVFRGETRD